MQRDKTISLLLFFCARQQALTRKSQATEFVHSRHGCAVAGRHCRRARETHSAPLLGMSWSWQNGGPHGAIWQRQNDVTLKTMRKLQIVKQFSALLIA